MTQTACTFGTVSVGQGSTLYANASPMYTEENLTSNGTNPGLGVRLAGRYYFTKFSAAFSGSGSADTVAFNAGHEIWVSISNFTETNFSYKSWTGVIGGAGGVGDSIINAMFTRMLANLSFSAAVTGETHVFGGYTQPTVHFILQHEVDRPDKLGNYASSKAATAAEFKAFWQWFCHLASVAGIRAKLTMCITFTQTRINDGSADAFYPGDAYVDEIGSDVYIGFNNSWQYSGSLPSFQTAMAGSIAYAQSKSKPLCIPEIGIADSGNDTQMQNWFAATATYINSLASTLQFTGFLHWGQASNWWQNFNKLASQDTLNGPSKGGHLGKHTGIINMIATFGSNQPLGSGTPTSPTPPPNLQATASSDGTEITMTWDPMTWGDGVDVYLLDPNSGQTYLHRYNASTLAITPRSFTFGAPPTYSPLVPGTSGYIVSAVASLSTTGQRSGYGNQITVPTPTPGAINNAPSLTASAQVSTLDPLNYTFTASATDPDPGQTLTYGWSVINTQTNQAVTAWTGAGPTSYEFGQPGAYTVTASVTDSGSPPITTSQVFNLGVSTVALNSPNFNFPMLQSNEDIRDMGPIDRGKTMSLDAILETVYTAKSPHNAQNGLVASTLPPFTLSGATNLTPAPGDLVYGLVRMEDTSFSSITTISARIQTNTGLHIGFWSYDGNTLLADFPNFDSWLNSTTGALPISLGATVSGFAPGDLLWIGIWHPNTWTSGQTPQYRASTAGSVAAAVNPPLVNGVAAPVLGTLTGLTSFPAQLDFTKYSQTNAVFIGLF